MPRTPSISYKKLARKIQKAGYNCIRTRKHPVYYNSEKGITIPVPFHSGDVPKGTLRAIIHQMDLSLEEFLAL